MQQLEINNVLMDWLFERVKDTIKSTIEDNPEKVLTLIAVNNMMNQIKKDITDDDIFNLISDKSSDEIFNEIKNNI